MIIYATDATSLELIPIVVTASMFAYISGPSLFVVVTISISVKF